MSLRRAVALDKPSFAQLLAYGGPVGTTTRGDVPPTFKPSSDQVYDVLDMLDTGPPPTPEEKEAWLRWHSLKQEADDEYKLYQLYQWFGNGSPRTPEEEETRLRWRSLKQEADEAYKLYEELRNKRLRSDEE